MIAPAARRVVVRRTGGFAGLVRDGSVDLDGDDPRVAEIRSLLGRVDMSSLRDTAAEPPHPDGYTFTFETPDGPVTVPEHRLTGPLRRIADLLLA